MPVVILVDEYDKPLVRNLDHDGNFEACRTKLTALYSNFKTCAAHIKLVFSIEDGEPEEFMKCLQAYFDGVPYDMKMDNENNFQNAFYILTTLLGIQTEAEVHTSDGRIDLVLKSEDFIFVVELKYDGTAREAMEQIERKHYGRQFENDPRRVFLIGASFSSEHRTIDDWKIF